MARHLRAAAHNVKRQNPPEQPGDAGSPQQNAITRGYSDGWRAAKTFASAGGSRLGQSSVAPFSILLQRPVLTKSGFSGQFISDALTALGSEVMSGDAGYYRTWFCELLENPPCHLRSRFADCRLVKGLADGEVQVLKSKALEAQGPDAPA